MSKERLRQRNSAQRRSHERGRETARAHYPIAALQAQANQSPSVTQLSGLQRGADTLVQREVDRRPITNGGNYDRDGNLTADRSVGVPNWAQDHYRRINEGPAGVDDRRITTNPAYGPDGTHLNVDHSDGVSLWAVEDFLKAEKTVMVSMIDGKIGSIYFDGGRIRTTHAGGPKEERHDPGRTIQLNIDHDRAGYAFEQVHPPGTVAQENLWNTYQRFLVETLFNSTPDTLPGWITFLRGPNDSLPENTDTTDTRVKLFEIMVNRAVTNVESIHPSRGAGVQMTISNADMAVLRQGLKIVEDVPDVFMRNQMFYNFVLQRVPHLAPLIRDADEVTYR